MAASETRMLILGAVAYFGPVNGHQVQRELTSWGVAGWGEVRPGSVYSMLETMSRQGLLERHELRDGGREVAVHLITGAGQAEFDRMIHEALATVVPTAPLAFHLAFNFFPLLDRDDVLDALRRRQASMREQRDQAREGLARIDEGTYLPPHIRPVMQLTDRVLATEQDWLEDLIEGIEGGVLRFRGDGRDWTPPPDDPGWRMVADRDRYRALLGID